MEDLPQVFFAARLSDGERTVLQLGGECDAASLDALNGALADALAQSEGELVVDVANVVLLDSVALGALTAAAKLARADGRPFRLVNPPPPVRRTLELTGLDGYLLR